MAVGAGGIGVDTVTKAQAVWLNRQAHCAFVSIVLPAGIIRKE